MITALLNNYSLTNIFILCFHIFLPMIIYVITNLFSSSEQQSWFSSLKFDTGFNIFNNSSNSKGFVIGVLCFIITGVANLLILDFFYYKNATGEERSNLVKLCSNFLQSDNDFKLHFYLFPLMIFISNIGFPIALQTHTFMPLVVLLCLGALANLYLMFHYARTISYTISLMLLPLLLWQISTAVCYSSKLVVT